MASSRLERIGTIYTRVEGLLRSKAMQPEDRPIWWDVYRAFPPHVEPIFSRPVQTVEFKSIFYVEDKIRAKFHFSKQPLGSVNLKDSVNKTNSQYLISIFNDLKKEQPQTKDDVLYEKALEVFNQKMSTDREDWFDNKSKMDNTQKTQTTSASENFNPNIKNIFDD